MGGRERERTVSPNAPTAAQAVPAPASDLQGPLQPRSSSSSLSKTFNSQTPEQATKDLQVCSPLLLQLVRHSLLTSTL